MDSFVNISLFGILIEIRSPLYVYTFSMCYIVYISRRWKKSTQNVWLYHRFTAMMCAHICTTTNPTERIYQRKKNKTKNNQLLINIIEERNTIPNDRRDYSESLCYHRTYLQCARTYVCYYRSNPFDSLDILRVQFVSLSPPAIQYSNTHTLTKIWTLKPLFLPNSTIIST